MLAAADSNNSGGTFKPAFKGDALKAGGPLGSSLFQLLNQPPKKRGGTVPYKSKGDATNKVDGEGSRPSDGGGVFSYKFKEGHSKNFKRELNIDFFLN